LVIMGAHHRDNEGVKRHLSEASAEVMARLSAASMESYSRAYPLLVRLHMLQEASDAAHLAARGSLGPIERQRTLRWEERLRITQSSLATQVICLLPGVLLRCLPRECRDRAAPQLQTSPCTCARA
jgi:serine/threonine-protein kinase ATR